MGLYWVSTEARTGRILADLPNLYVPSVKTTIGRYETVTATLPINTEDAPPEWKRATKKNAAHLILLQDNPNDPAHGIPLWGARINRRRLNETDVATLDLMTLESHLDRLYVGNKTYAAVGQNDIIADLINTYVLEGSRPGLPIRVQYTTAGAGQARDRSYLDSDDKTLYSVMTDLMGVIGGCEWTIGWEWQTAPERITPVLYVGDRIGTAATTLGAPATFDMPGCVKSFDLIEDYGIGKGANDVMAVSSGQGNLRPQSARSTLYDPDMPTIEYRWTPSTSITDVTTLNTYASNAVAKMSGGSTALAVSAFVESAPDLGVDWFLGDDLGYVIGGLDATGIDTVPAFPGGIKGIARAAGWELTVTEPQIITPTLVSSTGAFDA